MSSQSMMNAEAILPSLSISPLHPIVSLPAGWHLRHSLLASNPDEGATPEKRTLAALVHAESVREMLYVPIGGVPAKGPYLSIKSSIESAGQTLTLHSAITHGLPWGERLSVFSGNVVLGYADYRELSSLLYLDYIHINTLLRGLGIDEYLVAAMIQEAIHNGFTAVASKYEHHRGSERWLWNRIEQWTGVYVEQDEGDDGKGYFVNVFVKFLSGSKLYDLFGMAITKGAPGPLNRTSNASA